MEAGKRGAGRKQRSYDPEYKEAAVGRMLRGENVVALSRELKVARAVLYRWRDVYRAEGRAGLARSRGRPGPDQEVVRLEPADRAAARIAELERMVGQQAVELDFFERAFRAVNLATPGNDAPAASASTPSSTRCAPKADSASSEPVRSPESREQDSTGS